MFINGLVHFDKISKDNFRGGVGVDKNNEANFILNYAQSLLSWHLIQSITFFTLKWKEVVDAGGLFIGAVITRFESVVTFPGKGINTLFFFGGREGGLLLKHYSSRQRKHYGN
ncbi:hypothetical protein PGO25_07475 [Klebsiella aerogenes]